MRGTAGGMEPAEAAGAEQRTDGERERAKEWKKRRLLLTLNGLEGVQCWERNYDSLFHMHNIKDLLMVIKLRKTCSRLRLMLYLGMSSACCFTLSWTYRHNKMVAQNETDISPLHFTHLHLTSSGKPFFFFALKPQNWLRLGSAWPKPTAINWHELHVIQRVPQKQESVKSSEQPQICTNYREISTRIKHICVKGSVQTIYRKK